MADAPVTLLLTDVEGSTRMMEQDPDRARRLLAAHDRLVGDTADEFRGRFVRNRSEGDSAFLVFDDARDGVRCAVALQKALAAAAAGEPLRVRMGLHAGRPHRRGDQLYGPVVNRCGAVRNLGHGGQILLSSAVAAVVGEALPDIELVDLGEHRLKGINDREQIFQAVHTALEAAFPPLRSPDVLGTNLIAAVDDFVDPDGRVERIVAAVGESRLVTLVGAGGLGKSRLALEVGLRRLDHHDGGVWRAELGGATSADALASRLAGAVGVREQPGRPLLDTVADHLRPRHALLVLDGSEGVRAEAAGVVATLLAAAPDLRILVTSRQALGVAGERVEAVAPLPSGAAVDLFVRRAGSRAAGAVAEVVSARLEGIPLAIELAAAQADVDDPGDAIAALERWLDRQEGDALRATLDWSHELLEGTERALLARSSVFVGGFTLEAAEGVCADDPLGVDDVLDALAGLAAKSLVQVVDAAGGARYGMYDMVRQYAADRLADGRGVAERFRRRHYDWFAQLVADHEAALYGADQVSALDLLDGEHANVLAALATDTAPADARLWTAASLARFWQVRGHWSEGLWTLRALLTEPTELHHPRAHAQATAGLFAMNLGDYAGAENHFAAAREGYLALEASGDDEGRRRAAAAGLQSAAYYLGDLARTRGDLPAARDAYEESLARARELDDSRGALSAQFGLGSVLGVMGDLGKAIAHLSDALAAIREIGDAAATAQILNNMGGMKWFVGDFGEAHALYEESLSIRRGVGDVHGIAESLRNLADVAIALGRPGAATMCSESADLARSIGDRRGVAEALLLFTEAALADGDHTRAARALAEAEDEVAALGDVALAARALLRRSTLQRLSGDLAGAIEAAVAAVDAHEAASDTGGWASSLAALARAQAACGDVEAATAAVVRALADPPTAAIAGLDVLEAAADVLEAGGNDADTIRASLAVARHRIGVASGRLSLPPGGAHGVAEALVAARDRFR